MVKLLEPVDSHATLAPDTPDSPQRSLPPLPWEQGSNDPPDTGSTSAPVTGPPRQRVRHSFDIFADQLLALRDIALRREVRQGGRVRLGDLVQEALDAFIVREQSGPAQNLLNPSPTQSAEAPPRGAGGASEAR